MPGRGKTADLMLAYPSLAYRQAYRACGILIFRSIITGFKFKIRCTGIVIVLLLLLLHAGRDPLPVMHIAKLA